MTFEELKTECLKDPEVKREYDALEGYYQMVIRMMNRLNNLKSKHRDVYPFSAELSYRFISPSRN